MNTSWGALRRSLAVYLGIADSRLNRDGVLYVTDLERILRLQESGASKSFIEFIFGPGATSLSKEYINRSLFSMELEACKGNAEEEKAVRLRRARQLVLDGVTARELRKAIGVKVAQDPDLWYFYNRRLEVVRNLQRGRDEVPADEAARWKAYVETGDGNVLHAVTAAAK